MPTDVDASWRAGAPQTEAFGERDGTPVKRFSLWIDKRKALLYDLSEAGR